jgi:hypothetical protein
MSEKGKSLLERLDDLSSRAIWSFVILIVVIPLLIPFSLPVTISEPTQAMYDYIESLNKVGTVALVEIHGEPGHLVDVGYGARAVLTHIWQRPINAKLVIFTYLQTAVTSIFSHIDILKQRFPDKIYGEDYVFLGFIPGGAPIALSMIGKDIWAAASGVDVYGTPLANLPMMTNIHSMEDVDLAFEDRESTAVVQYWYNVYETPIVSAIVVPEDEFYRAGFIKGFIASTGGVVQYEKLIAFPGPATKMASSMAMGMGGLSLFIIVVNIVSYRKRMVLQRTSEEAQ